MNPPERPSQQSPVEHPTTPAPTQPAAPPTAPGQVATARRPRRWPNVLGIMVIVLGSVSALGGGLQLISALLNPLMANYQQSMTANAPPGVPSFSPYERLASFWIETLVLQGILFLLAGLQIFGGVLLVRRKPLAVPICRWWALGRVLAFPAYIVLTGLVQWAVMGDMMQAVEVASGPPGAPGGGPPATGVMLGVMVAIGVVAGLYSLAWGWAMPLFVWFWLGRPRIREDVERWGRPAGSVTP